MQRLRFWQGLRVRQRFEICVGAGLIVLVASVVLLIARFEQRTMESRLHQLSVNEMTSLHALIVNVMTKRPEDGDNIGIQVFNNWFQSRNANYAGKVWSTWSPKVTQYMRETAPEKPAKPPQDAIDREALASGRTVARFEGDAYRYAMPIVLGVTEGAKAEVCHGCHGDGMGLKDGEVIAVLSSSLSTAKERAALRHVLALLGGGGILATALAMLLMHWALSAVITNPLARISGIMQRMAGGDTQLLVGGTDKTDEIGDIARAVEQFRQGLLRADRLAGEQQSEHQARDRRAQVIDSLLKHFSDEVTAVLDSFASAATRLKGTSQEMATTAGSTSAQASIVAAAVEQTAASMRTLSGAAERLAKSVDDISGRVDRSAEVAAVARDKADTTNHSVQSLSQAVTKIGEIVDMINDIAAKTNLLALNATIEAARAGESGKGFAVVAGEVKSLATQTARATQEISSQIAAVQDDTAAAVAAIGDVTLIIGTMSDIASGIAESLAVQDVATAEIADNVQQVAQATDDVSANVLGVNRAADETGRAAAFVNDASFGLAQRAIDLRARVDAFLADIRRA